ncbi:MULTISPECIES: hypothetical protein [Wolbachia]|nr:MULTISPECIES: hypothetical protein [Wolbachia]
MFIAKRAQERCHSSAPVMSFQCLALESRNFIKLVSIKIAVLR